MLLRAIYLCACLGNPMLRTQVLDLLSEGEAIHVLQRAINCGANGPATTAAFAASLSSDAAPSG